MKLTSMLSLFGFSLVGTAFLESTNDLLGAYEKQIDNYEKQIELYKQMDENNKLLHQSYENVKGSSDKYIASLKAELACYK